jgi:hypothetical protein
MKLNLLDLIHETHKDEAMNAQVEYKIVEVRPRIFAVVVPNSADRALLFLRTQEFYESPNDDFRRHHFNINDFFDWYQRENGTDYRKDWAGFNVPFPIAYDCYEGTLDMPKEWRHRYDDIMCDIIDKILDIIDTKRDDNYFKSYIIGTGDTNGITYAHELAHGLYYTNPSYRINCDKITLGMRPEIRNQLYKNLADNGYAERSFNDEIQAYFTNKDDLNMIAKGLDKQTALKYYTLYKSNFMKFV